MSLNVMSEFGSTRFWKPRKTPTEISRQLGISRPTVYKVKATDIEKKVGSGANKSLSGEEVTQILMTDPWK
ncbi:Uncharacterized protein FKW44_012488 [Caligus rogercresseyi]|uniref:Uncharacterized protein n=1 Tax=Caligus rogercresseyi TaxID=217165 RepID=A0A7T8HJF3_CALRO|nr:Uncharacterized protein FKW44_012488 [Caligus rogercresseyi]